MCIRGPKDYNGQHQNVSENLPTHLGLDRQRGSQGKMKQAVLCSKDSIRTLFLLFKVFPVFSEHINIENFQETRNESENQ
jgi:hypothetical protein